MSDEIDETGIKERWERVGSKLDERGRRLWAAGEVQAAGHGALKVVSRITGLARSTITAEGARSREASSARNSCVVWSRDRGSSTLAIQVASR